jgi:hypothetical protein
MRLNRKVVFVVQGVRFELTCTVKLVRALLTTIAFATSHIAMTDVVWTMSSPCAIASRQVEAV